jgi:hypothetical protein
MRYSSSMSEPTTSLFDRAFAVGIAFLLPGLVALFGVAMVNDTVRSWFQGAQNGPTFAGLIFVMLAALALNVVITALRWLIFEKMSLGLLRCPWVKGSPRLNLAKRQEVEAQYIDLRHQHYYHYLAYANTAVAIPIALVAWTCFATPVPTIWQWLVVAALGILSTVALARAGCDAARRYDERRADLLGLMPSSTTSA